MAMTQGRLSVGDVGAWHEGNAVSRQLSRAARRRDTLAGRTNCNAMLVHRSVAV